MTAYEDVIAWIATKPWWQQRVFASLADGTVFQEGDYGVIARSLFEAPPATPDGGWLAAIVTSASPSDATVRLVSVKDVTNVNQLAENQELTFAPDGLTVVYGNNGSGKSGYARILQSMVRTRHRADILSDVFAEAPGQKTGQVTFLIGQNEHSALLGSSSNPALGRISFYDERCGDTYLNSEAEISYRPSAIQLLDDLSTVCVGVRKVIDQWKTDKGQTGPLPDVDGLGVSGIFLSSLTAKTTDEAIATAIACPSDIEQQLREQVEEVARIRTTDPVKEKQILTQTANALDLITKHLTTLGQLLSTDVQQKLAAMADSANVAQTAAEAASSTTFGDDPLSGIGSPVWKTLWQAAEKYSLTVYSDHEFPHTGEGAVCVLCQQSLDGEGAGRLNRFHKFISDTTAKDAERAKTDLENFRTGISQQAIDPRPVVLAMATVEQKKQGFSNQLQPLLDAFRTRQTVIVEDGQPAEVGILAEVASYKLWAQELRDQAISIDATDFADSLALAQAKEKLLRDQVAMRDGHQLIEGERTRLRELALLKTKFSEASTSSITGKVGELTRTYVTEEAIERFTQETDRFELERVTFKATKPRQGSGLPHKADFVSAQAGTRLGDVLSEGEQTVLGFAGFLTEVHFDASKSALVFDDPVSSLDHLRRDSVAARIVTLAEDRQVIVFTHDVAFTMALRKTAGASSVAFATRGIERRRKIGPGYTTLKHPWTAQDAAQRLQTLDQERAALSRDEKGMTEEEYVRATESLAGHMSQTWERIVSQVLAEPLIDYKTLEVKVGKLRIVGRVTEKDVKTYDDSYSRISGWASRHDPHPEINYVAPAVEVLKTEIGVMTEWFKNVKKYQQ